MAGSRRKKSPNDPRLPRTCDVCQSVGLEGPSLGTFVQMWYCTKCGSEFEYFHRVDGELFDVPRSWGRCIGVVYATEAVALVPQEHRVNPEREVHIIEAEYYYVFQADDGTIRRARMGCSPFGDKHRRPADLPKRIQYFHYWNVDVWPPTREMGTGG